MAGSPLSAPHEHRFRWYRQVERYNKSVPEVCAIFGMSRKTYYKWYRHDHGLTGNRYKARAVHPHTKLTPAVQAILVDAKQKYNYGPLKMRLYLRDHAGVLVSPTTIYKFYQHKQLIRKPQKKQAWYTPMSEPYYARFPGENVQIDVKYVPKGDGVWSYQYRCIDTVTRIQYAIDMSTRDAETSIVVFREARRCFPFTIMGVQTDNGGEFRGAFHAYLLEQGIIHRYIPKRSAPWNGKVERANRSVDDEFYLNPTRPWQTLAEYTHWYNHERYHLGKHMHGMTPYEKLALSCSESSPLKGN